MRVVRMPLAVLLLCLFFVSPVLGKEAASTAASAPLVSVIVPTYQRSLFLAHALQQIRSQDYPNIEIVVVDDSPEPSISSSVVEQYGIVFIRLTERKSIGEKRNIAVSHANGDVIVHWDDDDFFRRHRISSQVQPILDGEVDMTVLEHHLYLLAPKKEFFSVKRASSWGPHFATFSFRRSIFTEGGIRYPDNSMAEDYAFAELALEMGYKIKTISNVDGKHIYVRHQNTWQIDFSRFDAQVDSVEKPDYISQQDVDFYATASVTSPTVPPPLNHYAAPNMKWTREELHSRDRRASGPHYGTFTYNTGGMIISIPIAVFIILATLAGVAVIFYTQWDNIMGPRSDGYQPLNVQDEKASFGAGPSKGYGSV